MLPYSRIFAPQIDQIWLEFEPGRDRRFRRPEPTESHLARNSRSANLTVRNSECVQWGYKNDDVVVYANRLPDGLSELFGASIYGRPSRTWTHVRAFSCTKSSPGTCASKRNRGADARHPAFLHGFPVPLSNNDSPAIIAISVNAGCGVNPNCEFLVFRQHENKDILILSGVAVDWDFNSTRHHGYHDLTLTNYQGVHRVLSVWQFDGHQYCLTSQTDRSSDGAERKLPVNHGRP